MKLLILLLGVLSLAGAESSRPQVGFYSEGLCPFCRKFISEQLMDLYKLGFFEYVDVSFYPSGNAHWRKNGTTGEMYLRCQHGDDECVLNRILNCGVEYAKAYEWMPFAVCVEDYGRLILKNHTLLDTCSVKSGYDPGKINECFKGPEGQMLFEKAYNATQNLVVPHKWVPWVVYDDVPLYDAAEGLATVVCCGIPKDQRPAICYKSPYEDWETEAMLANDEALTEAGQSVNEASGSKLNQERIRRIAVQ